MSELPLVDPPKYTTRSGKMSPLTFVGPQKIAVDFLLFLIPYIGAAIFKHEVNPFVRGFYCDDESIRYPFHVSTVNEAMLYGFGYGVPLICIIAVETCRYLFPKNGKKPVSSYKILRFPVHPLLEELYRYCGVFVLGAGVTIFLTDIGKYTIGRLRPHFVHVCDPDWNLTPCFSNFTYITDVVCKGDPRLIREARLSFPSGHSATSFFSAVFTIIYLQCRANITLGANIGRAMLQLVIFAAAWFTALSRISNYKHHWSDVLAGSILGCLLGCVLSLHVAGLFRYGKFLSRDGRLNLTSRDLGLNYIDDDTNNGQVRNQGKDGHELAPVGKFQQA